MSESISANTTGVATTASSTITDEIQSTRGRRHVNKKKRNHKAKPKFVGAEEGVQGHVCDIERPGKPCEFIVTTECVRDCMHRKKRQR